MREVQCTEVWGGVEPCDVSVMLAGVRGEVWSRPWRGHAEGGDIHFLSVCGMSILSKIVLADVSGHGAESAQVSRIIHEALNENVGAHDNSAMLGQVNASFIDRREGEFRFTTMVSMILDTRDRSLVYAYAGHPAILRGRDGKFEPLVPEDGPVGGIPIGVLPGTSYEQHTAHLEKGDVLVVYTDAFTEVRQDGEMLGERGLAELLESAGSMKPPVLKERVLSALADDLDDDASLLVLEVL
ncbi:MAG: PP2C family protein-serine/threonine phosphatase [Planctomycetota bacterium]|jgi:sigma-B regulation protein RsbU (phosphoserine phosphatase)